jgi:hypothetical protein
MHSYVDKFYSCKKWVLQDGSKISSYNKNILAAMALNGYEFLIFQFIWEGIKAISDSPHKSCGYAPYVMHLCENVAELPFG